MSGDRTRVRWPAQNGVVSELTPYPREAAERETAMRPEPTAQDLAEWGSRAGAYLLDSLLLLVPLAVVLVGVVASDPSEDSDAWGVFAVAYLASFVLPFFYFAIMHGGPRGQTFGKRGMGIRVVDGGAGGSIGYGRAFGRYAIMFVFGIFIFPALLDYLWPLWDEQNQSLHDKVVGSLVVRA
jgi:uncharacterized RDD family membrane protein YckC